MTNTYTDMLCRNSLLFFLVFVCQLCGTNISLASEEEQSKTMLDAIFNNDLERFEDELKNGANPTIIFSSQGADYRWIICEAANSETAEFLELISSYGWDLEFRQSQWSANLGLSLFETPLLCSVANVSSMPFKYLIGAGVDLAPMVCEQCEIKLLRANLFEFLILNRQYEKSAWLLETNPVAATLITENAISQLAKRGGRVSKKYIESYWRTVDAVRDLGHEVNTEIERELD